MLPTLPKSQNFLELEDELSNFQKSQAVILPVPFEFSTTFVKGTRKGPEAILAASRHLEDYDDELDAEPCKVGIATLLPLSFEERDPEKALNLIGQTARKVMQTGKFLITIGGEHSITIPLVKEANKVFDQVSVLHLDAHSDLRDNYQDSPFNHACVMARVNEICDFVSVGLRSGLKHEGKSIRPGARLFYAGDMVRDSDWINKALDGLQEDVYLTLDLDFFDPSIMPSVGTPEAGGFFWYETLEFLRQLFRDKNVVACDVVELSPIQSLVHPDALAAKLIYKIIAYKFFARIKELSG